MGGIGSGTSRKRKTLPRHFRPGAIAKADQRVRGIRHAAAKHRQLIDVDLGGADQLSVTQAAVAERFTFVDYHLSALEAAAWNGASIDWQRYLGLAAILMELSDRLGYTRRPRPVESLHDYMRRKSAATLSAPAAVDAQDSGAAAGPPPVADLNGAES